MAIAVAVVAAVAAVAVFATAGQNGVAQSAGVAQTLQGKYVSVVDSVSPSVVLISKLSVGDIVLAIGNPLGLHASVTEGIVSSLDRSVSESNGATLTSAIQTSAAINPGNSGGALVDLSGHVIGVPTVVALDPELGNSQASGIGFAISSNQVKTVAARIVAAPSVAAVRQEPAAGSELVLVP